MLFCDTSALMKLYVNEVGSLKMVALAQSATSIFVAEVTWVEMRAALAQRVRLQSTPMSEAEQAIERLRAEWSQFQKVVIDARLCEIAGDMAAAFGLRAYDSVQLTAADQVHKATAGQMRLCCFDKQMNAAAKVLGIAVFSG
jgi:uncharacterized protein